MPHGPHSGKARGGSGGKCISAKRNDLFDALDLSFKTQAPLFASVMAGLVPGMTT